MMYVNINTAISVDIYAIRSVILILIFSSYPISQIEAI